MDRYWIGITTDDGYASETFGTNWNEISKNLKSLSMTIEDKNIKIQLPDNMEYLQAKTCGADLLTGNCHVESRYIGFKLENHNIIIRVDEKTGNINVEVY